MFAAIRRASLCLLWTTPIAIGAVSAAAQAAAADRSKEAPKTAPAPSIAELTKAPTTPLDSRVAAAKITEVDLPPLPERVILPMPPILRISKQAGEVPISPELWKKADDAIKKGLDYLRARQDAKGGWMAGANAAPTDQPDKPTPVTLAVTALAVKAFVQAGADPATDKTVRKALELIMAQRSADGLFDASKNSNYVMSCVLSALASVDVKQYREVVQQTAKLVQTNQWDQTEGLSSKQDWFGGAGYGNGSRPDLSNTGMMLDALYDAGLSPDEPAFQKALAFASRTQNLKATNKAAWAGDDGGFVYTPANGGESMASEAAGEGRYGEKMPEGAPRSLRSYGSMTYAGFKSMLYAGLSPDDVRVRAAFDWIRAHWSFDENPGLGAQGLFYYYHVMSRALTIAQQNSITDSGGKQHNWREELVTAILARQDGDGHWKNQKADRWMEGEPELVTVYAVLALEEALKPAAGASGAH